MPLQSPGACLHPGDPGHAAATRRRRFDARAEWHRVRGDPDAAGVLRRGRRRRTRRGGAARGGAGVAAAAGGRGRRRRRGRCRCGGRCWSPRSTVRRPGPISTTRWCGWRARRDGRRDRRLRRQRRRRAGGVGRDRGRSTADLGDEDAEFTVGDAQDHDLAWYATQELPFCSNCSEHWIRDRKLRYRRLDRAAPDSGPGNFATCDQEPSWPRTKSRSPPTSPTPSGPPSPAPSSIPAGMRCARSPGASPRRCCPTTI